MPETSCASALIVQSDTGRLWQRRLIKGWCPPGGVVLDPFGGTGTTAMVGAKPSDA